MTPAPNSLPVALVTGASRGIGRAVAETLAGQGLRIAVHYRRERAQAQRTLAALAGTGHALVQGDLARPETPQKLIAEVVRRFGRIDALINNAGIYELHRVLDDGYRSWRAAWRRTIDTNLLAPADLCYFAARAMARRGGGRIVNISSRGAFRGEPDAPAYGASKAGLNALGQSLARALAPRRVYVYTIAPGWVDTDMATPYLAGAAGAAVRRQIPLGRVATAKEIAQTVAFLVGDAPASMTGAILDVNGASYLRT